MTASIVETEKPAMPLAIPVIDPAAYAVAVFEPFRAKLDAAKVEADKAEFDITTTAGMEIAKKHRAVFRDEFRIAIEKAREERKAPILQAGKLLDAAAKKITEEVVPYELRFDEAIKAEEKRKADIKAAKEEEERQRVVSIRARIAALHQYAIDAVGKTPDEIAALSLTVEAVEIGEDSGEFVGGATLARDTALDKIDAMYKAATAAAEEAKRLAEERAELERQRQEQAQREEQERARIAADFARQEAELKAQREKQDRELAEQRAKQEEADRVAREEREAEERRLAAERREIERRQAELEEQRRADEAERQRREREIADAEAAETRRKKEEADEAARVEAARIQAEKDAAEAERVRRERVQFELNGPEASEMVFVIAAHYMVDQETALNWMNRHVWADVEVAA